MSANIDPNRLYAVLNNTGLQNKNQPLYQLLYYLIGQLISVTGTTEEFINNTNIVVNNFVTQYGVATFEDDSSEPAMIYGNNASPSGVGPPGPKGDTGATGAQGPIGLAVDGMDGDDSLIPGPMGSIGAVGPIGLGLPGLDGTDGEDSLVPGPPGKDGTNGIIGANGINGVPGIDGEINEELWFMTINSGSSITPSNSVDYVVLSDGGSPTAIPISDGYGSFIHIQYAA